MKILEAENHAKTMLNQHRTLLERVTEELLANETISGKQFDAILREYLSKNTDE